MAQMIRHFYQRLFTIIFLTSKHFRIYLVVTSANIQNLLQLVYF
jgi:hypothetical protein